MFQGFAFRVSYRVRHRNSREDFFYKWLYKGSRRGCPNSTQSTVVVLFVGWDFLGHVQKLIGLLRLRQKSGFTSCGFPGSGLSSLEVQGLGCWLPFHGPMSSVSIGVIFLVGIGTSTIIFAQGFYLIWLDSWTRLDSFW